MGRIGDLCSEIAAVVDEGPDGFVLPVEAWERLGADWPEEDIEDGINFVTQSIFQSELVEAADSLSTRLLEVEDADLVDDDLRHLAGQLLRFVGVPEVEGEPLEVHYPVFDLDLDVGVLEEPRLREALLDPALDLGVVGDGRGRQKCGQRQAEGHRPDAI